MKAFGIAVLIFAAIASVAGSVWAWQNFGPGRVCAQEHLVTLDFGANAHPTVEAALTRFGRFPGVRGDLPAESLVPTEEDSPVFGATIDADTRGGRQYDIWKDGEIVQTLGLKTRHGGWVISGYSGCSPIP